MTLSKYRLLSRIHRLMKPDDDSSTAGGAADDGAGNIQGTDTVGTGNADRLALLDRINDHNDRQRADELRDVNDDDTTADFVAPVDENAEDDTIIQVADLPADTVEPTAPVAPSGSPKIKVNGEEVELTAELIAKAQKIASADKYLEDAAKARKAITPAPEPNPAPALPSPEDVEAARSEEDRALVRAIQVGTEEEAVKALTKLRQSLVTSAGISPSDVGRIADERLTFKTAITWFNEEYKDLVEDPNLHLMVMRRDKELVDSGDSRTYKERYEAIGNEIREWRTEMVGKFAPPPASTPAAPAAPALIDKNLRKASAPAVPLAAGGKGKAAADPDEEPETPSAVIAKMAQTRGGPQWAR